MLKMILESSELMACLATNEVDKSRSLRQAMRYLFCMQCLFREVVDAFRQASGNLTLA